MSRSFFLEKYKYVNLFVEYFRRIDSKSQGKQKN